MSGYAVGEPYAVLLERAVVDGRYWFQAGEDGVSKVSVFDEGVLVMLGENGYLHPWHRVAYVRVRK
jgi:hypothetical protein